MIIAGTRSRITLLALVASSAALVACTSSLPFRPPERSSAAIAPGSPSAVGASSAVTISGLPTDAVTSVAPAPSHIGPWTAIRVPRTLGPKLGLSFASCPDPGFCTAVGSSEDAQSDTHVAAASYEHGRWITARLPVQPGELYSVSCPVDGWCVAAGTCCDPEGDIAGAPAAFVLDGGTWTQAQLESPPGSDGNGQLTGISCPTRGSCVAVGYAGTEGTGGNDEPIIETLVGGAWHATVPRFPRSPYGVLVGVACRTSGFCATTGRARLADGSDLPVLGTGTSGSQWDIREARLPAAVTADDVYQFNSVTCPSDGGCIASAETVHGTTTLRTGPLTAYLSGSTWSLDTNRPLLGYVSCAAVDICGALITTGQGTHMRESLALGDGHRWHTVPPPLPPDASSQTPLFVAVTCAPSLTCASIGYYKTRTGSDAGVLELASALR